PSNVQNPFNTLSLVFKSKNLKLINFFINICSCDLNRPNGPFALPDNSQYYDKNKNIKLNTLTNAINTENIDIVKIAHTKFGALPDCSNSSNNTLLRAFEINNLEIIKEIVFIGGKFNGAILTYCSVRENDSYT